MTTKLKALRSRLLAVQRELISLAADIDSLPSDKTIQKIANLEVAIGAVESMIDDAEAGRSEK
ncbi:hypothetical protein KHC23_11405 [Ancylobacter dichloromethanicus]|uniref:Uncharacterized protein n=1 Tax=Ancylobacter dichloromethanicus TaxID=518825 RepID=A0A9W6MYT9_9HYPH|nr:hypothetical protein [Ancylobacter dichloromethanicus]MBS7554257.1 hypothetical protein [Ancylobacter dichloromethanicus]GLK71381.1 hypothetical protein GCM10017643_14960 [Ancylobacter dichloromethanicus]